MPCEACNSQFTMFKRKKACLACQRLYCPNCIGKRKKSICFRCEIFSQKPSPTKKDLMDLKTKVGNLIKPIRVSLIFTHPQDLIFYLQSKKINIAGIVEKEELANLIINHLNTSSYYETGSATHSSTSTTPNNDFDNYAQSFDQIKQTCQNLFTSISDKIASGEWLTLSTLVGVFQRLFFIVDFQKTTCFNQPSSQNHPPTTQQPRRSTSSAGRSNLATPQSQTAPRAPTPPPNYSTRQEGPSNVSWQFRSTSHPIPSSSNALQHSRSPEKGSSSHRHEDCDCSDDEIDEISEKRQSILLASVDGNPGTSGVQVKTKVTTGSSSDASSFEELDPSAVKLSDDNWQIIEKTASNGIRTVESPPDHLSIDDINMTVTSSQTQIGSNGMSCSNYPEPVTNPGVRRLTRRRSDSSLLSLRKSNSITIDSSSFDPTHSASEVKKLKISCNKCGKAKSNIKQEILKLSEQLKSSNRSDSEVNAKIKEFLDYLESKSQPSEMTESENSQVHSTQDETHAGAHFIPTSSSQEEIEENVFDENEGINVYPSSEERQSFMQASSSTPRRFISLDDIHSMWVA